MKGAVDFNERGPGTSMRLKHKAIFGLAVILTIVPPHVWGVLMLIFAWIYYKLDSSEARPAEVRENTARERGQEYYGNDGDRQWPDAGEQYEDDRYRRSSRRWR